MQWSVMCSWMRRTNVCPLGEHWTLLVLFYAQWPLKDNRLNCGNIVKSFRIYFFCSRRAIQGYTIHQWPYFNDPPLCSTRYFHIRFQGMGMTPSISISLRLFEKCQNHKNQRESHKKRSPNVNECDITHRDRHLYILRYSFENVKRSAINLFKT